ncbi:ABC transporter ATP-binding protein [Kiritimatiella glycovorans]|uniref:Putative ABC transporter ATP-binding protein YxlF n=1 Tax=Kiritimatiella glycovorans TaxID=1307763 RepID=A0A0G3EJT4_9BACT|nr:ATP-binding cassette domain-containing protein [Kiritimatiella glycovorans]AKJ65707.1 putative ABC transporter ATP-binding protein YxlF [Kiritimatiella glycovorans]
MIEVRNLCRDFGPRRAVDDVSFEVNPGTVLGFLGPNGAGKTTTLRAIAGYLSPTSGTVRVAGRDVAEDPPAAQRHIGYMPENAPLYDDMLVEEFLAFVAETRGFTGEARKERVDAILERCFLKEVRHQGIDTLSRGYRRRTCLAQTLLHDPDILLLDEPTEGLDPNQKQVVRDMIREMAPKKAIVISTHVLEEVEAICTRAVIISSGRIVADDTPDCLKRQSPGHGAVRLCVGAPAAEAESAFGALEGVREVRRLDTADGRTELRLVASGGRTPIQDVTDLARRRDWVIYDLRMEEGRLEDVFRRITTTEDAH